MQFIKKHLKSITVVLVVSAFITGVIIALPFCIAAGVVLALWIVSGLGIAAIIGHIALMIKTPTRADDGSWYLRDAIDQQLYINSVRQQNRVRDNGAAYETEWLAWCTVFQGIQA